MTPRYSRWELLICKFSLYYAFICISLQSDDVFRVSRRYHWHHYQSLFFSTRKRSAFFVMSFCYAARLKLCLLLINWGFVDPWKSLLAEIMRTFFLSLCREISRDQRHQYSLRQYFENLYIPCNIRD